MVKIGYGIADFRMMVRENLYYIDRTMFLPVLEDEMAHYNIFLRPRRFGKSLWISVLQYYYGVQFKDQFEELFGQFYAGKNPTKRANTYLILRFNFSGISTEDDAKMKTSFLKEIKTTVEDFMLSYPEYFDAAAKLEILSNTEAHDIIRTLFKKLKNSPNSVYLLIDEYDHFTNELISLRLSSFKDVVTQNGWVRKFYEALKNAAGEGIIGKMFLTGVSPITVDSLTSGFNISTNQSSELKLHNLMGFTRDETEKLMQDIGISGKKLPETMEILKTWYNGYSFNARTTEQIYNSDMVLYFAYKYQLHKHFPDEMLDVNIASDYTKIRKVFQIGDIEANRWEYIDKLMRDETVKITLTSSYSFERGFSTDDFLSLLYYMGFLTIKKASLFNAIEVKMPNRVIADLYRDYFINIMNERAGYLEHDIKELKESLFCLAAENNPRPLLDILCQTLKDLSHRDFQKIDEKHIQAMFFCYVNLIQMYDTKSEYESERKFYDILMLRNGLADERVLNEFLFEFKYAKNATENRLGKIDAEAKLQVEQYLAHKQIKKHPNLHAWRIVIVGYTLEICEAIEIL